MPAGSHNVARSRAGWRGARSRASGLLSLASSSGNRVEPTSPSLRIRHELDRPNESDLTERARAALHRHDPHARNGCCPESRLGPPGNADGARPGGVRAVVEDPSLRSEESAVAGPRPFRTVVRSRVDAAVFGALSDRLRDLARRHQELPPARFEDAGT